MAPACPLCSCEAPAAGTGGAWDGRVWLGGAASRQADCTAGWGRQAAGVLLCPPGPLPRSFPHWWASPCRDRGPGTGDQGLGVWNSWLCLCFPLLTCAIRPLGVRPGSPGPSVWIPRTS